MLGIGGENRAREMYLNALAADLRFGSGKQIGRHEVFSVQAAALGRT